jgi:hypothetical protein
VSFAEFFAGRCLPYLPASPAVVVPAVEEQPAPPPVLVVTNFEPTVEAVEAAELEVIARLSALVDEPQVPWLWLSPLDACRTLFNPIGGDADVA